MNRVWWALLITGVTLLVLVQWIRAWGALPVIVILVALAAITLKARNRYVGHQASGVDAANQPGRAVTVADRTSRWWDTEREIEHGARHLARILPYTELRIGSKDKAARQLRRIANGQPVRPIDWTAPNRNGGAAFGGGMTASGMTYDWCTCSEQAMPLIVSPDGSTRANVGAETCVCQCSECAPKGRYRDPDGKMVPIKPRHWRERDAEHEMLVNLHASRRAQPRGWSARWVELQARIEDVRNDRADRRAADAAGWVDPQTCRRAGEDVNTDTDEWHYRRGDWDDDDGDETPGRHSTDRPTDPIDPRPGGHE